MRIRWIWAAAACAILLAACGSSARPAPPPVRLSVERPADGTTTLSAQVLVRGTVGPGTPTVLVAGRPATVRDGSFSAWVPVAAGANVIDVLAGAPRAAAAMSVLRVHRELPVAVPDVTGADPSAAARALGRAGLRARVRGAGGFFQSLLPFVSKQVCSTDPPAGSSLAPGSAVTLVIARIC